MLRKKLTFCIFGRCDLEFLHRSLGNRRPGEGNYLQQCGPEAGIWVHKAAQKCRKFRQQNFPIVAISAVSCKTLHTDLKSKSCSEKYLSYESSGTRCPEINFNKISNTIHKTYIGLASMLQGFQKCIA